MRVYTRDTATWKLLTWEGKALLALLFRKLDRAGLAELGENRIEGLAALVDLPEEIAERGLESILIRKVALLIGDQRTTLLIPNFLSAQEAHTSDAQRKRDQRERAAAQRHLVEASRSVTPGHASGQNVTNGHSASQVVTPILSEPSLTEPDRKKPSPASPGDEFDFDAVYAAYPRKEGKKKGLQRCRSQIKTREKYDALLRAVKNYAAIASPGYEKHFDTFMGCWEDYVDAGLLTPRPAEPARAVGHAKPAPHNTETREHEF